MWMLWIAALVEAARQLQVEKFVCEMSLVEMLLQFLIRHLLWECKALHLTPLELIKVPTR